MEQRYLQKRYSPVSRVAPALILMLGGFAFVGYGNFLDWVFSLLLAVAVVFEEKKWAEPVCWIGAAGKIAGLFWGFLSLNLTISDFFDFRGLGELNQLLQDPTIDGALRHEIQISRLGTLLGMGVLIALILYMICQAVLYFLIPQYLGRHYNGRGGIVFACVLLIGASIVNLLVLLLMVGYSYVLSLIQNMGINADAMDFGTNAALLLLKVVAQMCLPLGTLLYFRLCRKSPRGAQKDSSVDLTDNLPKRSEADAGQHYCAHCQKEILPETAYCPYCDSPTENRGKD